MARYRRRWLQRCGLPVGVESAAMSKGEKSQFDPYTHKATWTSSVPTMYVIIVIAGANVSDSTSLVFVGPDRRQQWHEPEAFGFGGFLGRPPLSSLVLSRRRLLSSV